MRHFILLFLIAIILILIIRNNENIIEGQYEYSLDSDSILPDISISKDISPDDASTSNSLLDSNAWINMMEQRVITVYMVVPMITLVNL